MAHKPFARGVTQLMYVGDVPDVPAPPTWYPLALVGIGVAVLVWLDGRTSRKRR